MIEKIMQSMIAYCNGSLHDINHMMKVWAFARTIGRLENLPEREQQILETAAIVHDIACPSQRERYGHSDHKLQETEGMPLAEAFLSGCGVPEEIRARVVYLVGHHHTVTGVDGMDYQILLEADYLVNAGEWPATDEQKQHTVFAMFRTSSGKALMKSIYGIPASC